MPTPADITPHDNSTPAEDQKMSDQTVDGARQFVVKVAEVATAIGWQAGVAASDLAGLIVSFLAVHPEHIARFLAEGSELFVDGTIRPEGGCLSYLAQNGSILTPSQLRATKGQQQ